MPCSNELIFSKTYIGISCLVIILADMDKFLTKFIYDVAAEEPDLDKRANLKLLKLSPDEWKRVQLFIKLLEVRTCLLLSLLGK